MKNRVSIQDHESIPFHRGRPNFTNPNEDTSVQKKVDDESKQSVEENKNKEKSGSIPFHKRERGLVL